MENTEKKTVFCAKWVNIGFVLPKSKQTLDAAIVAAKLNFHFFFRQGATGHQIDV